MGPTGMPTQFIKIKKFYLWDGLSMQFYFQLGKNNKKQL